MKPLLKQLTPFITVGIILVTLFFGMMLLVYLCLIGAILGLILFIGRSIQRKFFSTRKKPAQSARTGRIIDSNDWKKL